MTSVTRSVWSALFLIACGGKVDAGVPTPIPEPVEPSFDAGGGRQDDGPFVDAGARPDRGTPGEGKPRDPDEPIDPGDPSWPTGTAGTPLGSACLRAPRGTPKGDHVHVIGVYEGKSVSAWPQTSHEAGDIDVTVTAAASPATLVLSSYEAVRWHLYLEPGASLKRVVVNAYEMSGVTVDANIPLMPIERLVPGFAGCAYGWESPASQGGCAFTETIDALRSKLGVLESTFQGSYTGSAFTVPPGPSTLHSHYDNDATCADACTVPSRASGWDESMPGMTATMTGSTATISTSIWGSGLRAKRGARCGKHYFEVDVSGALAAVGVDFVAEASHVPLYALPSSAIGQVQNGRIGVALDLDRGFITFVGGSGGGGPLPLWSYEEVVPAVDIAAERSATVSLVTRPPFQFPVPAGYASDL